MQLTIEKMVYGGPALAHTEDGKAVMVWGALPNEVVGVEKLTKRKGVYEVWAEEIIQQNDHRRAPEEAHFGSCSPWQIMDYDYENEQKVVIAREAFQRIGKFDWPELKIIAPQGRLGYRNKIEFSFYIDDDDLIHLAFFHRGSKRLRPIDGCVLAMPVINDVAAKILDWVRENNIPKRSLKSLIVRANREGQVIAALLLKDTMEFASLPACDDVLQGFQLVYSTHKSPASVFTEVLATVGTMELTERIGKMTFTYDIQSFFQVYLDVFEQALDRIATAVPQQVPLLDFYSGVGSIGLPLADAVPEVVLVESNAQAVACAERNIALSKKTNVTAHCAPAEKITELIDSSHTLIVDPPRAGLHADVTQQILNVLPEQVAYLSCNVSTQARDLELLRQAYDITLLELYNFFPATPHIESLAVLRRR